MKRRRNGEGLLRERVDGRWEARIIVGYNDGKPIMKTATAKTRNECLTKLEKLKEQYGQVSLRISSESPFGEWIDYWYQTFGKTQLRQRTQATYENYIYNHITKDALAKIPLRDLTTSDLQKFYGRMKCNGRLTFQNYFGTGLSNAVVRSIHMVCRASLEKAVKERLIYRNPSVGCKLPPKRAKEMKILSNAEIERLLAQAKAENCFEFFLLELVTGLRLGEICSLKWSDLNMQTGLLQIVRQASLQKGDKYAPPKTMSSIRAILLPQEALMLLKELKTNSTVPSEWIFPSVTEPCHHCSPHVKSKALTRLLSKANCKHVRFHDLRHTFASLAIENGMDIKTLSATIGHKSVETTINIYSHITDTMQRQAAERIEELTREPQEETRLDYDEIVETPTEFLPQPPTSTQAPTDRKREGRIQRAPNNMWKGSFHPRMPDGKKKDFTVYASTREECEEKLAAMIAKVKAEIKAEKEKRNSSK